MFKKAVLFCKKIPSWLKWLILSIATWFVSSLFDSFVNKEALFNSLLVRIPSFLLRIKIPASVFLLAFAAVALSLWSLNKRIKNIKATQRQKGTLRFMNNSLFIVDENGIAKEGPFCSSCYDQNEKLIQMHTSKSRGQIWCPVCKKFGGDK